MDLTQPYQNALQDFFQQSRLNNLILPIHNETHKYYDDEQIFKFQNAHSEHHAGDVHNQADGLGKEEEKEDGDGIKEDYERDGKGENIEQLLLKIESSQDGLLNHLDMSPEPDIVIKNQERQTYYCNQAAIQTQDLESIITFLVQQPNSSIAHIQEAVQTTYPQYHKLTVVKVLMEKFSKLKKTKQELIKYCMRKAFKFILQLPKNQHILDGDKRQKYSFSKCKNKYLKYPLPVFRRVSQQKSMNNKFLQQIFSECDFKRDYIIFLQHFEGIMIEDNQKKINYLAEMLTNKEGRVKSVEMVKRLPWTRVILQKVAKIARELLKFSGENGQLDRLIQ